MSCPFAYPVACMFYYVLLEVVSQSLKPVKLRANGRNNSQQCWELKMKRWSSQWTQFMQLCKEAWKKFRTSTGFEPETSRSPVRCSDIGSRSIVGSYIPVKEMSVTDIWNKSYINCRNEMKMKKWSSQWTQFMQLRKEALSPSANGSMPCTYTFFHSTVFGEGRWEEVISKQYL